MTKNKDTGRSKRQLGLGDNGEVANIPFRLAPALFRAVITTGSPPVDPKLLA